MHALSRSTHKAAAGSPERREEDPTRSMQTFTPCPLSTGELFSVCPPGPGAGIPAPLQRQGLDLFEVRTSGRSRPARPRLPGVTHLNLWVDPAAPLASGSGAHAQSHLLQSLPLPSSPAVPPVCFFSLWGASPLQKHCCFSSSSNSGGTGRDACMGLTFSSAVSPNRL